MTTLQERFVVVAAEAGSRQENDAVYTQLEAAYASPGRVHRGIRGLEAGLSLFDMVRSTLEQPALVELAWWFHDVAFRALPLVSNEDRRQNLHGAVDELLAKDDEPRIHVTDDHVFLTRAARLEEAHAWNDLYFVTYMAPFMSRPAQLGISFGPLDDRSLTVNVDDPAAQGVVGRLRSIPGYRHDEEAKARELSPTLVYSRARCGEVVGPVRLPEAASSPYRG